MQCTILDETLVENATTDEITANKPQLEEVPAEKAYRLAYEYDAKYGYCPQCVLAAISEATDLDVPGELIKATFPGAGGGALMGQGTCGALLGGIIALGLKSGRTRAQFGKPASKKSIFGSKELVKRFQEKYGNGEISCNAVQMKYTGKIWDMWDPEESKALGQTECKKEICPQIAGDIARWTVELL